MSTDVVVSVYATIHVPCTASHGTCTAMPPVLLAMAPAQLSNLPLLTVYLATDSVCCTFPACVIGSTGELIWHGV